VTDPTSDVRAILDARFCLADLERNTPQSPITGMLRNLLALLDAREQQIARAERMIENGYEVTPVGEDCGGFPSKLENYIHQMWKREPKVATLTQERDALLGTQSAHDSLTRVIAEAVGDGDPSGPYWEDGVRFLAGQIEGLRQERATLTEALRGLVTTWREAQSHPFAWRDIGVGDCISAIDALLVSSPAAEEKLERSGADVKNPYAVGMAQAKKSAAKKKG